MRREAASIPRRGAALGTTFLGSRLRGEGAYALAAGPRKAVLVSMLPKERTYRERFQMAKDAGFAGVDALLLVPAVVNPQTSYQGTSPSAARTEASSGRTWARVTWTGWR